MSKGLRNFPEDQRLRIATRRLNNGVNTGVRGNGFWGAKDYFTKNGLRLPGKLGAAEAINTALERMQFDDEGHAKSFSTGGGKLRSRPPRDRDASGANKDRKGGHKRRHVATPTLADIWPGGRKGRGAGVSSRPRTSVHRGARQLATR